MLPLHASLKIHDQVIVKGYKKHDVFLGESLRESESDCIKLWLYSVRI